MISCISTGVLILLTIFWANKMRVDYDFMMKNTKAGQKYSNYYYVGFDDSHLNDIGKLARSRYFKKVPVLFVLLMCDSLMIVYCLGQSKFVWEN